MDLCRCTFISDPETSDHHHLIDILYAIVVAISVYQDSLDLFKSN